MIDVDRDYPSLSSLARSQGETLRNLADTAKISKHQKLTLAGCLSFVLHPERIGRHGFHQYLGTLDDFVRRIVPEPTGSRSLSHEIWVKLIGLHCLRPVPCLYLLRSATRGGIFAALPASVISSA